jgi:hypothetical protein
MSIIGYILGSFLGTLPDPLLWLFVIAICVASVKYSSPLDPLSVSYFWANIFALVYSALLRRYILAHEFSDNEAVYHTFFFMAAASIIVSVYFGIRRALRKK